MRTVRAQLLGIGPVALVLTLAGLTRAADLGPVGWLVGLGCGTAMTVLLVRALDRLGTGPGPADVVTMVRGALVCGVAALVADRPASVTALTALATVALILDAVDGAVARRTATASALGARFDMEVDAFLILVLSLDVAPAIGWWVVGIGAARYALGLAGAALPRLRRPVPPRYWRKVVAAIQGITLTAVASEVVHGSVAVVAPAVAAALLAESFGRDVVWLARARGAGIGRITVGAPDRHESAAVSC